MVDIFVTNYGKQVCDTVLSVVYFIFANITCRGIEIPQGLRKEGKNGDEWGRQNDPFQ